MLLENFYHPQTKFAKVMFSQVSVCPQGGCLPHCMLGYPPGPEADTPLGRHPPGRHPRVDTPQADTPQADTLPAVHAGIRSTSRRYASHWNAFLFFYVACFNCSGINFVLSALVFNVVPTIFEVSLVTGILVSCYFVIQKRASKLQ